MVWLSLIKDILSVDLAKHLIELVIGEHLMVYSVPVTKPLRRFPAEVKVVVVVGFGVMHDLVVDALDLRNLEMLS